MDFDLCLVSRGADGFIRVFDGPIFVAGESGSSLCLMTSFKPCSSIEVMTINDSGYTTFRLPKISSRLKKSKSRSKLISATSYPNRMLKQIGHSVGMSQNLLRRFAMIVKPPDLPENFEVYAEP